MRLSLEHLDARAISVELPAHSSGAEQTVNVRSATALRGVLERTAEAFRLQEVEAEWLVLEALSLLFGRVRIEVTTEATLGRVRAELEQRAGHTELELTTHGLHASRLEIEAGRVFVAGEARMRSARLTVRDREGRLEAEHARIEDFRLRVGPLSLSAAELSAETLVVGWGAHGFRLEAKTLSGPSLVLESSSFRLDAESVELSNLGVLGANVSFASASVEKAGFEAKLASDPVTPKRSAPKRASATGAPARPVFDYRLLDGLSGSLHVDLVVDMTVPIIGRRRATHKLRLAVEEGSIDYREVEAHLSALEESLLDFAVRDRSLVLERGIPLLPTRGFGKPLLVWTLDDDELELAHRRRIKLSVLPRGRLASELAAERAARESEGRESGTWSFALQRLGLENIALELALHEVDGALTSALERLSFKRISARGDVHHELAGEARPGLVHAEFEGLHTSVSGLALSDLRLDVGSLRLGRLRDTALAFVGLTPTHLKVAVEALSMKDTKLTNPESGP